MASEQSTTTILDRLIGFASVSSESNLDIVAWIEDYLSQHGVTSFGSVLGEDEETLAEIFKARGYDTAGFVSNFLVQQKLGFAQGFDLWKLVMRPDPKAAPGKFSVLKGRGDGVNSAVFEWLDARADQRNRPRWSVGLGGEADRHALGLGLDSFRLTTVDECKCRGQLSRVELGTERPVDTTGIA